MKNLSFQKSRLPRKPFLKRTWFKIFLVTFVIGILAGGSVIWKAGWTLSRISEKGILSSLVHNLPGFEKELKGLKEGRINILLLGMRGENIPGGGLLADSIMVISLKPAEKKAALISIPRDLYVDNPARGHKTKINEVYAAAAAQENGKNKGLENMKSVLGEITGQEIHYAVSINFKGFKDLVNALGGVEINLDQPFIEPSQFRKPHVCDPHVFTVPTGEYQLKKDKKGRVVKSYPLCVNKDLECGGVFKLPAGKNQLDGEKALCFVRSRYSSNDFERAKRQQIVLQAIKNKATSMGTLTDFGKINNILDAIEQNVRIDLEPWELQEFFQLYQNSGDFALTQKVLDDSEEGLLYSNKDTSAGYILLPRGENYEKIRALFRDII